MRTVVVPVCEGFEAMLAADWGRAVGLLTDVLPVLVRVGGSAAQREIVEEALLFCLVSAGDADTAANLLAGRLERRPSPLDLRRLTPFRREAALQ